MFTVVLDACVLIPPTLSDLVLRIAETGVYDVRWSAEILDEVQRHLGERGIPAGSVRSRVEAMRHAFPFAEVEAYEHLIPVLRNDPKDRHVLAVAIQSRTETVVTFNERDFPADALAPWDVSVLGVDDFLSSQLDLAPGPVLAALHQLQMSYRRPPVPMQDILGRLERSGVPQFTLDLRRRLNTH